MSPYASDQMKAVWQQQMGSAKVMWGKLTEDEFLELSGQKEKFAGLLKERYAITLEEADRQVRDFFALHKP
jgi:uncharacterized protein YjbJ (UPF0337 family)